VLDRAEPMVADRLTERGLPFVFYTGRQSNEFARWPHVPILVKPASVTRIVSSLAELLHPQQTTGAALPSSRRRLRLKISWRRKS
jgi:hypothetical protein